jgi:hypothetical protein
VLLILALAVPLLMLASVLVRRRRNDPQLLPAPQPIMLVPPDPTRAELLPPAPILRTPEEEPTTKRPREEPPRPLQEPDVPLQEPPRITRRPPPVHGSSYERRVALRERILAMRAEGMTLQQIADQLTQEGEPTPGGGRTWQTWSVRSATRPVGPGSRSPAHGKHDTS